MMRAGSTRKSVGVAWGEVEWNRASNWPRGGESRISSFFNENWSDVYDKSRYSIVITN